MHIAARRSRGDDVEVDGSCEHLAVVVVGVVAGDLASASDREKGYLAVGAEELCELVHGVGVAYFLRGDVLLAVEGSEDFVEFAVFDSGDSLLCVHD